MNRLIYCVKIDRCIEKAVSNFFKPASQKEADKITWRIVNDSLLVGKYNASSAEIKEDASVQKTKIAAFDFVITTFLRAKAYV